MKAVYTYKPVTSFYSINFSAALGSEKTLIIRIRAYDKEGKVMALGEATMEGAISMNEQKQLNEELAGIEKYCVGKDQLLLNMLTVACYKQHRLFFEANAYWSKLLSSYKCEQTERFYMNTVCPVNF